MDGIGESEVNFNPDSFGSDDGILTSLKRNDGE